LTTQEYLIVYDLLESLTEISLIRNFVFFSDFRFINVIMVITNNNGNLEKLIRNRFHWDPTVPNYRRSTVFIFKKLFSRNS